MPFSAPFDAVFDTIRKSITSALPGETIRCHWLKEMQGAGRITDDIVAALDEATFCIADVSTANANVMWETGYAMALSKPTILIGQDIASLPFDLRVHRVLPYSLDSLSAFGPNVAEAVRQTLARYELKSVRLIPQTTQDAKLNIVVTGSRQVQEARARRRLEMLTTPYLGRNASWYCGSSGLVDDLAVEYLHSRGEQVIAVTVNRWGMSEGSRKLVQSGAVSMIDSSLEDLPRGMAGSAREVLFCTKADLIMLIWDGQSHGTRKLMEYFTENGKSLLVGFA
jgi:hypothetical protein